MKSNPSDLAILNEIYTEYLGAFLERSMKSSAASQDKIYIPIDVERIASKLGMNKHILWGRLYYHLDQKYGYVKGDVHTNLFAAQVGNERHCIHFPLLSAIVADRERELRRYILSLALSVCALVVAIISLTLKSH